MAARRLGDRRILIIAIVLLAVSFSFVFSGNTDTTGAAQVEIVRWADLEITKASVSNPELSKSEINVQIHNSGLNKVQKDFAVSFYEREVNPAGSLVGSWESIGSQRISNFKGHDYAEITHDWEKRFDNSEIKIVVDEINKIKEKNEDNNEQIIKI